MIVGMDHLGCGVASLDQGRSELEALGYSESFRDLNVPNDRSKAPYLHHHAPLHDLALFRAADGSPALELVRHGAEVAPRAGSTLPSIVVNEPPSATSMAAPPAIAGAVAGVWRTRASVCSIAGAPRIQALVQGAPRVLAYVVATADRARALTLWSGCLGFLPERQGDGWSLLRVMAPVPQWRLTVVLVEATTRLTALDDAGATTVALLTTDIATDRRRIREAGVDVAEVFSVQVAGRNLRACVGRTPDGDLVELLQVTTPPAL